jgi:hypothetical protein
MDRVRLQRETPFGPSYLKAMTDNSQFAAHRVAADYRQTIIAIFGDFGRGQSVEG